MGRCLGGDLRERGADLLGGATLVLVFSKRKRGRENVGVETGRVCLFVYLGFGVVYIGMGSGAGVMGIPKRSVGAGRFAFICLDVRYERLMRNG